MLAVHRYLFRLALAAGNVFGWIVVFRTLLFYSNDMSVALAGTTSLYLVAQLICFLLTPLAGAALRHGTRRALVVGSLMLSLSFISLAALFVSAVASRGDAAFWLVASFAIFGGISRAIYFVPYATAAAHLGDRRPHALLREFSLAIVPLLAIILIMWVGTGLLFALAAALAVAAVFAIVEMPNTYERFDWSYGETVRALVSPAHRGMLGVALFDGMQGAALLLIWPLGVYLILFGSLSAFGAVMATTFLFALGGRLLVRYLDRPLGMDRSPYILATIAFSSWVFRLPAGTPLQIVAADVFYHSAAEPRGRGVDAHSFDQSADNGHYVDEQSALKEMGHAAGRIIMCALFATLTLLFVPVIAFAACIAAAAVAAAASVLFAHHLKKEAF